MLLPLAPFAEGCPLTDDNVHLWTTIGTAKFQIAV